MIVGYHLIFSAYGFWLPNDPRGSWSEFVGAWDLFRVGGGATKDKVTERRSYARDPHDRAKRLATKEQLIRPPVVFTGIQARAVGRGFGEYVKKSGLRVWACAIMPDHVHLVVGKFRMTMEQLSIQLKQAATTRLVAAEVHPFQHLKPPDGPPPKCFAVGEWKGYLDPDDVVRCVHYVQQNPIKEGLPTQVGVWPFVTSPDV